MITGIVFRDPLIIRFTSLGTKPFIGRILSKYIICKLGHPFMHSRIENRCLVNTWQQEAGIYYRTRKSIRVSISFIKTLENMNSLWAILAVSEGLLDETTTH